MKPIFKNRKEQIIAFKDTFGSSTGQKVLLSIAELCGKGLSTFDSDPIHMAYKAARQDTYLEIQRLVDTEVVITHKDKVADSDQTQSSADDVEEEDDLLS